MANTTSGSRRQPFRLYPQNANASNTFSFTQGTPMVSFSLPDSTLLVESGSLRLNYTIKATDSDGTTITDPSNVRIDPNVKSDFIYSTGSGPRCFQRTSIVN